MKNNHMSRILFFCTGLAFECSDLNASSSPAPREGSDPLTEEQSASTRCSSRVSETQHSSVSGSDKTSYCPTQEERRKLMRKALDVLTEEYTGYYVDLTTTTTHKR